MESDKQGKFILMINPIDASENFENSGSIFAIFRRNSTRFKGLGREDLY